MATWQQFGIDLVQAVIFTPDQTAGFSSGKAVKIILTRFQERYSGEMQVLPLPAEVPPEIPRVVLVSDDNRHRLAMAPSRIDSVIAVPPPHQAALPPLVREAAEVVEHYVQQAGSRVGRLALIVHRLCPDARPAQTLIERFCNEASQQQPFNRSESFEIHNHKVYTPPGDAIGYPINSWVRCKSGKVVADGSPVILVEQDLNTLSPGSESRNLRIDQMQAFFAFATQEAEGLLTKYFPG